MSRSKEKNESAGNTSGTNIDFYRARNRAIRARNRHVLCNMLVNYTLEHIADTIYTVSPLTLPRYDFWREPTDGRWSARSFQYFLRSSGTWIYYLNWINPGEYEETRLCFEKMRRK